jgi:hypothetical protein
VLVYGEGRVVFAPETRRDIGLIRQALIKKWNVDKEAVKSALMNCLQDPDLAIDAAKCLLMADALDVKREESEAKREAKENEHRLRLLALAQSVPVADLAELASKNGIISNAREQGRATKPGRANGKKASEGS